MHGSKKTQAAELPRMRLSQALKHWADESQARLQSLRSGHDRREQEHRAISGCLKCFSASSDAAVEGASGISEGTMISLVRSAPVRSSRRVWSLRAICTDDVHGGLAHTHRSVPRLSCHRGGRSPRSGSKGRRSGIGAARLFG